MSFKTKVTALLKMDEDDDLDEFEIEEQEAAVAAELDDSQTSNAIKKSLDEGSWFAIIYLVYWLILKVHTFRYNNAKTLLQTHTQAGRVTGDSAQRREAHTWRCSARSFISSVEREWNCSSRSHSSYCSASHKQLGGAFLDATQVARQVAPRVSPEDAASARDVRFARSSC